jgi:hypothetical protein
MCIICLNYGTKRIIIICSCCLIFNFLFSILSTSVSPFAFDHWVFCPSSNYSFWLPILVFSLINLWQYYWDFIIAIISGIWLHWGDKFLSIAMHLWGVTILVEHLALLLQYCVASDNIDWAFVCFLLIVYFFFQRFTVANMAYLTVTQCLCH